MDGVSKGILPVKLDGGKQGNASCKTVDGVNKGMYVDAKHKSV